MPESEPMVRLKRGVRLADQRRPLWMIAVPAWWRGAAKGTYIPIENTLSYSRSAAWEKFSANYHDVAYRIEVRKTAKAVKVQVDLWKKTAKKAPWWGEP